MSLNLYSAGKVDDLLSVKLSVSSLSNAATSTLDATAPTAGQALTFDGTNLVWATVGGGGGGASWGSITGTLSDQTDLWTALGNKADVSGSSAVSVSGSGGTSTIGADSGGTVSADNGSGSITKLTTTGITFPDSTTMTTAPTAGANTGDVVAISVVQDVTWIGSAWVVTFSPINPFLGTNGTLTLEDSSGSLSESVTGWSSTAPWTYATSTFGSTDYIYVVAYGNKSTQPVNNV